MSAPSSAPYVASRRIGNATVTVVSDGSMPWLPRFDVPEAEWRRALPEADRDGRIVIGLNAAHIRTADASIVIDPGCDDPTSAWQGRFASRWPGLTRSPGLMAGLDAIGVRPSQVSHVVITHAHGDHFGGVTVDRDGRETPRFPAARHFLGRAEWDRHPERGDPSSDLSRRIGLIRQLGLLELIEAECEIAPGATLIPAPGETPGHLIVRLRSAGDTFFYVGDLIHHPCEVEHPDWAPPGRDLGSLRQSRARFAAEAVPSRATVVFSHARFPAWGRIRGVGERMSWESTG